MSGAPCTQGVTEPHASGRKGQCARRREDKARPRAMTAHVREGGGWHRMGINRWRCRGEGETAEGEEGSKLKANRGRVIDTEDSQSLSK